MASLRAGIVGVGAMGRNHARVLREMEGVDLVAIADSAGDRFGVAGDARVCASVDEMIAVGLDMAIVAVPTVLHEAAAIPLARAGVPTLIEKPVAGSVVAAQRIEDEFESRGVPSAVGHIERFNQALAELRRRLRAGQVGEVLQIATRRQSPFPTRINDVGVIMDLAVHDLNTTQWLAGSDYASVSAWVARCAGREHEDLVSIAGVLEGGVIANHIVNWLTPFKERQTVVTGEHGTLVADSLNVTLTYYANGASTIEWDQVAQFRGVTEGEVTRYELAPREPLRVEDEAFRDFARGSSSDVVLLREGIRTLQVAAAVQDSSREGHVVVIDRRPETVAD